MKIEIDLPDHLVAWLQSDEERQQLAEAFSLADPHDLPDDLASRAELAIQSACGASKFEQPIDDDSIPF